MDRGPDPRRRPHPPRLPRVAHRAGRARPRAADRRLLRRRQPLRFAAKTLGELGYENVASLAGGYTDWKRNGFPTQLPRSLDAEKRARYSRHLLIPEVGVEGQLKLLDSRILLIGAGGLGSPAVALSRRGRRRHARHRRRRPRRRVEPAAPDRALDRARSATGRPTRRSATHRGAQPRRRGRHVQGAPHLGERRPDPRRRLGRDRRRRRQLPDALPRQRRLRLARHPDRARLDLPLRGPGHRLQAARGPVLPLPLPAAAAARARAELRRGRRARRAARHRRLAAGERGAQARARHRRVARPAACSSSTRSRPSSARSRSAAIPNCPVCGEHPTITEYIDYVEFCSGRPTHA